MQVRRNSIRRVISLRLTMVVTCGLSSLVMAQTGSVVTVNADNVMVINGQKEFPIGFSPGPPNNSLTSSGGDGLQELRNAGALLTKIVQTNNWNSQLIA